MTWFSATAVTAELSEVLALGPVQAAWLTNGVQAGFVIGALTSSLLALSDIWRLTFVMAVASLVAGLANAMILFEPSPGIAILARMITGAALALIYPPAMKFVATWFRTSRGLAMGTMVGALTLGSALPHLVRGAGFGFDWQWVIIVSSLASLIAAVIFILVLHEGPHPFARTKADPRQIGAILRNRSVMLANLGYFGHMWELYAMWGWMLAFSAASLSASGQMSTTLPSLMAFLVIALGAPSSVIAGMIADRIGRCYTTALCMAVSGLCALTIGLSFGGPVWLLVLIAGIWGLTIVADSAQFSAAVTELSDQTLVGSALAFQMSVGFLITVFTIWLVPVIAETLGSWRWTFIALVPGPLVGIWAMLSLRRMPEAAKIANGQR